MARMEATVASGVKNWYINFVSNCYQVVGNANWCQNSEIFFAKSEFFDLKVFRPPPRAKKTELAEPELSKKKPNRSINEISERFTNFADLQVLP